MKEKKNINECTISAKHIILSKIDVKGGKLTFSQRIELGKIFQSEKPEHIILESVFECLHNYKPKPKEYLILIDYLKEIIDGIKYWIEAETTMLVYEPTSEEIEAGIKEFSSKIGEFGTIKALAKAYGKDPDEILSWEYGKVFGILYTDLEEHKFHKAFNKVIEKRYKRK